MVDEIFKEIEDDRIREVNLQFSDLHGMTKCVTVSPKKLKASINEGVWFDGSSIEGFTRICESDMYLQPDFSTFSADKESGTARIICDVYTPDGNPFYGDPRYILKRAVEEASELGYEYMVGPELEFFLLEKGGQPHDNAGYFDFPPSDLATDVKSAIVKAVEKIDLEWEVHHHEVAPGQHEFDFRYDTALKTADRTLTLKQIVKSTAHKHRLNATFMPKPFPDVNGSGMHVHQSLFKDSSNIFSDLSDRYKLSQTAYNFIAGQLLHSKAITALVAPTVNSYKRLVPGFEAPVFICWGQINRSALIRIPQYRVQKTQSARAELRSPDPSANPYLAFAVMLSAGLDGIKRGLLPPEPINEDIKSLSTEKLGGIERLPTSLPDALNELEKDDVIRDALGGMFLEKYLEAKTKEWGSYRKSISEWERNMYLRY